MENGRYTIAILDDFKKAFDTSNRLFIIRSSVQIHVRSYHITLLIENTAQTLMELIQLKQRVIQVSTLVFLLFGVATNDPPLVSDVG